MSNEIASSVNGAHNRIEELESVRGLAALLVVIFHIPNWNSAFYDIQIVRNGYLMVDMFFVLSGFVIYRSYSGKLLTKESLFQFQFLRIGRLYPVHILILLIYLAIDGLKYFIPDRLGIKVATLSIETSHVMAFIEHLFLVQGLWLTDNSLEFNAPAWSISVELYTYFLFGLIVLFFNRTKLIIFALIGLASVAILTVTTEPSNFYFLLRCTAGFYIGCLTADIAQRFRGKFPSVVVSLVLLSIICFLQFKKINAYDVIIYFLTSLFILTLLFSGGGFIKRVLGSRILVWLGTISYSVYMSHFLILRMFGFVLNNALNRPFALVDGQMTIQLTTKETAIAYIIAIALIIFISSLIYVAIERPFREKSRLYIHKPIQTAQQSVMVS